jgi:hypothetical protein
VSDRPLYDEGEFRLAVHACWTERLSAAEKQAAAGLVSDVGLRSGVTAGKHLDPLAAVVAKVFIEAGIPQESVHRNRKVELPGYFRAEKQWDLVVVHKEELVAAVEFKSMLGSYGNNSNNRAEEAIGNAHDLLQAYEEGGLGRSARPPWLGFLYVVQREDKSTKPVKTQAPHFPVDEVFDGASYIDRAIWLCRRLVQKRLYAGSCVVVSTGVHAESVDEPADDLTFAKFAAGIVGRVGEVMA